MMSDRERAMQDGLIDDEDELTDEEWEEECCTCDFDEPENCPVHYPHEVAIWMDPQFCRPWCAKCSCGWTAPCLSEKEAQLSKQVHLDMAGESFLGRLSARG